MKTYQGTVMIWDLPTARTSVAISSKNCITFLLKYIYELQQILFESKDGSKLAILDFLMNPEENSLISEMYKTFGLNST